ncbi:MAG: amidase [Burkholderiales bacterium]|nr:amidase [Burkholderiales bacterium]
MTDPSREPLHALSATALAQGLRAGAFTAEAVAQSCLARIAAREPEVQAWAFLDPGLVLAQARGADRRRAAGLPLGALHGIPVGIKDIIDTADMPTEHGTVLHAGRRPAADAVIVGRLRNAGAIIVGKTVTTELATYAPGKTRNPHDPAHTPGGSSSGSAAAVAAGMVPLALGTQTNGSVIRPASYCGVYGFKPSYGLIPRSGVLKQSRALDQIGVFAQTVEDAALLAGQLIGADPGDPDALSAAPWSLPDAAAQASPPRFAFIRTPPWGRMDPDAQAAVEGLVSGLAGCAEEVVLPDPASTAWDSHRTVMEANIAANYAAEWARGHDQLSPSLRAQIERGRATAPAAYQQALARMPVVTAALAGIFADYDAILTPSTLGTAPCGLGSTGDPAFCTLWTFCGMPAINVPLLRGANGLPLGVQLVGPRMGDVRLLHAARWLAQFERIP